jgi:hypothetical protein
MIPIARQEKSATHMVVSAIGPAQTTLFVAETRLENSARPVSQVISDSALSVARTITVRPGITAHLRIVVNPDAATTLSVSQRIQIGHCVYKMPAVSVEKILIVVMA